MGLPADLLAVASVATAAAFLGLGWRGGRRQAARAVAADRAFVLAVLAPATTALDDTDAAVRVLGTLRRRLRARSVVLVSPDQPPITVGAPAPARLIHAARQRLARASAGPPGPADVQRGRSGVTAAAAHRCLALDPQRRLTRRGRARLATVTTLLDAVLSARAHQRRTAAGPSLLPLLAGQARSPLDRVADGLSGPRGGQAGPVAAQRAVRELEAAVDAVLLVSRLETGDVGVQPLSMPLARAVTAALTEAGARPGAGSQVDPAVRVVADERLLTAAVGILCTSDPRVTLDGRADPVLLHLDGLREVPPLAVEIATRLLTAVGGRLSVAGTRLTLALPAVAS